MNNPYREDGCIKCAEISKTIDNLTSSIEIDKLKRELAQMRKHREKPTKPIWYMLTSLMLGVIGSVLREMEHLPVSTVFITASLMLLPVFIISFVRSILWDSVND